MLDAAAYPAIGRMVNAGETELHVVEMGAPDAPAVVLIHGASGNARDFTFDLAPRLAGRYRVLAVDRPGHGHSPRLHDRGESPAEQAAAISAALETLDATPVIAVGHSYGASVAMALALDARAQVAGVVTLGGATMPWPGSLGPWYRIASSRVGGATVVPLVSTFATRGLVRSSVSSIFAPQAAPDGYAAYVGVGLTLRAASLRANARQVNTLLPHVTAMAERYPGLDLPVEVVHGLADEIVPVAIHGARMAEILPDAYLTMLEGVGHMPHHADPASTLDAIDRVALRAGLR